MKIDGHGQAKILNDNEARILFLHGFTSARDKAIGATSYYLGSRISETVQLFTQHVFSGDSVCLEIYMPKEITKGKIASRTIPTHPALAEFLKKYREESQKLLRLYEENGNWTSKNFDADGIYISHGLACSCGCTRLLRAGFYAGEQRYQCRACKRTHPHHQFVPSVDDTFLSRKDFLGVDSSTNYGFFDCNLSKRLFPNVGVIEAKLS